MSNHKLKSHTGDIVDNADNADSVDNAVLNETDVQSRGSLMETKKLQPTKTLKPLPSNSVDSADNLFSKTTTEEQNKASLMEPMSI